MVEKQKQNDPQWIVSELYERLSGRKDAVKRAIRLLQPYRPMVGVVAALEELDMTVKVLDELGIKERSSQAAKSPPNPRRK